jgi:squalene-hopene/tetraprenyl-beta-curcumene cyclase
MTSRICPGTIQATDALERASAYLLVQAERRFAEVRHEMNFSRAAGFTGSRERQSGDIFARATLANLFLDIADLVRPSGLATELRAIARSEAEYVAGARLQDRAGGWSYFPDLPELPPDADSLAAALSLFVRIAPEYIPLCQEPVDLVLAGRTVDGSFETWIVAPGDAPADRARMEWAIRNCWGTGADPDVLAHLCYALWLWSPARYEDAVRLGASKIVEMQQPDGRWRATWYVGPAYGTALAVRLLRETGTGGDSILRARRFLSGSQLEDGSWGDDETSKPLQTSLSMAALAEAGPRSGRTELQRGAAALRALQLPDGSWQASPWIQMEIGRATGKIMHVATYRSTTLTTAFCLRALLQGESPNELAVTAQ